MIGSRTDNREEVISMADTKSIKEIVEQAIIDLVQDGKIEIQDENGLKIDDLSLGINESDEEDEDLEDEEDDSDEEENN